MNDRPPQVIATAPGPRATCAANNAGIDTRAAMDGMVNTARLPMSSSRSRSAASSRSIADSGRSGSAVMAASIRRSRSISVSMLSASNTSVRNSTMPPMPAGAPSSSHRSARENTRSMRATWVSTGSGVTRTSPSSSPAAGPSCCQGRFCQANTTWTSG